MLSFLQKRCLANAAAAAASFKQVTRQQDAAFQPASFTAYDVGESTNIKWHEGAVSTSAKETLLGQRGCVLWFTGLSGSGKSTVACTLEHALAAEGRLTALMDGDNIRHGLNSNLGFSAADRQENIRRVCCSGMAAVQFFASECCE